MVGVSANRAQKEPLEPKLACRTKTDAICGQEWAIIGIYRPISYQSYLGPSFIDRLDLMGGLFFSFCGVACGWQISEIPRLPKSGDPPFHNCKFTSDLKEERSIVTSNTGMRHYDDCISLLRHALFLLSVRMLTWLRQLHKIVIYPTSSWPNAFRFLAGHRYRDSIIPRISNTEV